MSIFFSYNIFEAKFFLVPFHRPQLCRVRSSRSQVFFVPPLFSFCYPKREKARKYNDRRGVFSPFIYIFYTPHTHSCTHTLTTVYARIFRRDIFRLKVVTVVSVFFPRRYRPFSPLHRVHINFLSSPLSTAAHCALFRITRPLLRPRGSRTSPPTKLRFYALCAFIRIFSGGNRTDRFDYALESSHSKVILESCKILIQNAYVCILNCE